VCGCCCWWLAVVALWCWWLLHLLAFFLAVVVAAAASPRPFPCLLPPQVVWVFAGYKKPMEKLFMHNPGLPSRFPLQFKFQDYSEGELLNILLSLLGQPHAPSPAPRPMKNDEPPPLSVPSNSVRDSFGNLWGGPPSSGGYYATRGDNWLDPFGNTCAHRPGEVLNDVGSHSNPVVTPQGRIMVFDKQAKIWTDRNDPIFRQSHYPGSPDEPVERRLMKPAKPLRLVDEKFGRIAARRLASARGTEGFGNARAVRNLVDTALIRQVKKSR